MYKSSAYILIYIPHVCLVPMEARGGCQITHNSSYRQWEPLGECWKPNLNLLQEQQVFLYTKPSSQTLEFLSYCFQ